MAHTPGSLATRNVPGITLLIRQVSGAIVGQMLEVANSLCFQCVLGGQGYAMLDLQVTSVRSFLPVYKLPMHQGDGMLLVFGAPNS